jgi:hypothetical protein
MHIARCPFPPLSSGPVLVLGTDDFASAVGHALHRAGCAVLMARDATTPVLRRQMAFDPALDLGETMLEGVIGRAAPDLLAIARLLIAGDAVPVTALPADDLLCMGLVRGVVDARMRRREAKADLRQLTGFSVGLGPGFVAGGNVDLAVETAPEASGRILRQGATLAAHGRSEPLAGIGRERFVRAADGGSWRSGRAIGEIVAAGEVVGRLAEATVTAPFPGALRGLVADGRAVRAGTKLLEVDPRGTAAQVSGISPRAASIARATVAAVREAAAWHAARAATPGLP